jgi:hypothetical protein
MAMAFWGHKVMQTPQRVQDEESTNRGFLSTSTSKIPCGQTPMQTSETQPEHLLWSNEIGGLSSGIGKSTIK